MKRLLSYTQNQDKTEHQLYVSGFHCDPDTACQSMEETKRVWFMPTDKGILAYHIIQSFSPGEATPEQVHQIGCEFARRFLADRFECTVSTHLDKGHLHNHIVTNSVSFIDGRMFLRANPLACAVMSADDWSKYGRRVSKGCTGIAQIVRSNGYYAVAKVFDVSQTYGNKPYPIAAVESTKQIEKAIDVMREISPIPVLPKNEVEGFCYDAERQELVFCAAIPPQELLQRLPAEIVMAAAESSYAGISENELMRQTAAAISVEVCGRLGLPMPPDVVQTLEGMKEHISDGEERRALEKVRETAVTFGDAVCKCLKLERGQPAPQREER